MSHRTIRRPLTLPARIAVATAAAALAGATLTACGEESESNASATATSTVSADTVKDAASISVTDPWVKAVKTGMTAAFGTIVNASDHDITVVSATSPAATMIELHETVENSDGTMGMQPKKGGFVIAAGGSHELAPGGDHIMFMGVTKALKPGESIPITLTLGDGSTLEVDAVVKEFTGANEQYQNGHGSMDGMDDSMSPSEGESSMSPDGSPDMSGM